MNDCKYCSGEITLIEVWDEVEEHDPDLEVLIQGNSLKLIGEYGTEIKQINYCPMCGRKLGVNSID